MPVEFAPIRGIGKAGAGQWALQVYRANPEGFAFWPQALAAAGVADWEKIEASERGDPPLPHPRKPCLVTNCGQA